MKHKLSRQILPAIIMAGSAAVPVGTLAVILNHAVNTPSPAASTPIAALPSRGTGGSSATSAAGKHTYRGPVVNQPYGPVQATVTMNGSHISNVLISAPNGNPQSASINGQAVPLLRNETLQAQSAQVNVISGATLTSQAYAQSLQGALSQGKGQGNVPSGSSGAVALGSPKLSVHGVGDGGND